MNHSRVKPINPRRPPRDACATVGRARSANDPVFAAAGVLRTPGSGEHLEGSSQHCALISARAAARSATMVWECIPLEDANQLLEAWGRGRRFVCMPRLAVCVRRAGLAVAVALFGRQRQSDAHTVLLVDVHVATGEAITAALLQILQGVRAQGLTRVVACRAVAGAMEAHLVDFGFVMNSDHAMEGVLRSERLFHRV